jgi:TolA-binding protein
MAFNLFPYSNFHKLNLDWVIKTVKEAKEAMDLAVETVTGYESRLQDLETATTTLRNSLGLLQGVVSGHTLRLDQAQNDIQNHTQRINSLDSTIQAQGLIIDQVQSDISNHTQQITQLGTDVQEALDTAEAANTTAAAANTTAAAANTTAAAAQAHAERLQDEKLDIVGADAEEVLGVTGNNLSDPWPFYIKRTGADPADYEIVKANVLSRNILMLSSESKSGSAVSLADPVIRGVGLPLSATDAANKAYVDGLQSTVIGTTVEITPANNTIYKCGVLEQLTTSSPPNTGAYSIIFTSGATPTTTIIPATVLGLETFVAAANTIYEINVLDNRAVVGSWAVSA